MTKKLRAMAISKELVAFAENYSLPEGNLRFEESLLPGVYKRVGRRQLAVIDGNDNVTLGKPI